MRNRIRAWLCEKLIRLVMWLTDGVYCRAVQRSGFIYSEARQWRKGHPVQAPSQHTFLPGDVYIFLGGGHEEEPAVQV